MKETYNGEWLGYRTEWIVVIFVILRERERKT